MWKHGWQAVKRRSLDMSDWQMKTSAHGPAQPGQNDRFATAAGIPSNRTKDDSCRSVIIGLAPRALVILSKDRVQWMVQHCTADFLLRGLWRGQSYDCNRDRLSAVCTRLGPLSIPSATAIDPIPPDRVGGNA
jgi:hypothetical protein